MADPIIFNGCFGWYHRGAGSLGVVLCAPHGYEELCVHRHWALLAQNLANRGLPTLRFDYPGTGDSADDDEAPGRVRAWIDSIADAVRALRETSGVDRVALVGLRMGAMLATVAAEQIAGLAALVLLAPFGSGETCFRELRALAMMRAPARHRHAALISQAGGLEAAGFVYTPDTLRDLRSLRLLEFGRSPAERILVLNRPHVAADDDFRAKLVRCGADIHEELFRDYSLLLRNADLSVYPEDGFGRIVDWLAVLGGRAASRDPVSPPTAVMQLPHAEETPVFFNNSPDYFGVLCEPRCQPRRALLVFLNTGSNHHIGTSRMTVTMARRLARMGFASLRIDIGGIGDSDTPADFSPDLADAATAIADVCLALDWLENRGYAEFILIGLCSGAKLALETTLIDGRVTGQILLNLQGFWKAADMTYASRRTYFRLVRELATWKRVVRGEVDTWGIAKAIVARSAEALYGNLREARSMVRREGGQRSASMKKFHGLAARQVKTCFIYVEEDPGLDELEIAFGRDGGLLPAIPNISITLLKEGDHIFSWNHSRRQLLTVVEDALTRMTSCTSSDLNAAKEIPLNIPRSTPQGPHSTCVDSARP